MIRCMDPINVAPEIIGGAPCFAGARVPIQNFFDYVEGGYSVDEFLEQFPTVKWEQVLRLLELAREKLLAAASAA
jgi:uncharacterized protein (DUF433 family)